MRTRIKKSLTFKILKLSFPVMIGMMMHAILTFSDRYFIARLGLDEAAGASLSGTLFWVLMSFTGLVSGGATAMVSRKIGEKNSPEVQKSAEQSILLAAIFGLIIFTGARLSAPLFFDFFDVTPIVTEIGLTYYSTLLYAYPFLIITVVINAIFQAAGDTKTPMIIFSAMSLINLALDPIFIFGIGSFEGWGVIGAAWATCFAEMFAFIWMIFRLKCVRMISLRLIHCFIPNIEMIKRLLNIGLWSGLNSFSRPLSAILIQKIIAFYGTAAVAAFSFAVQWLMILFIFAEGIKVAVSTLVGQALGAGDQNLINSVIKRSFFINIMIIIPLLTISIIFSEWEIAIFSTDPEVIAIGSSYLKIVMSSMIFIIPTTIFYAVFNGAGDTKPPMIISFIGNWIGKTLFAVITTYYLNLSIDYVWGAIALSIIIEATGLTIWFKRGHWRHKKI